MSKKRMIMLSQSQCDACTQRAISYSFITSCIGVMAVKYHNLWLVDGKGIVSAYQLIAEPLSDDTATHVASNDGWAFFEDEVTVI